MSNPGSSTSWTVPSTGTSGTVTYSQATATGTGGGGGGDGGITVSNFNMKAITDQPHKEDKYRG